jgi:uncharacterized damage-inducible protein DinB
MGTPLHFAQLATYNQWMNNKLYAAAQQLEPQHLHADRQAFFGSVFGTLNHLVVADTLWLSRLARHTTPFASLAPLQGIAVPTSLGEQLFDTLAALQQRRQLLDAAFIGLANELTPSLLDSPFVYTSTKGVGGCKRLGDVLSHVFNHQAHHRGQATTLFSQLGVDVGPTDLILLMPDAS